MSTHLESQPRTQPVKPQVLPEASFDVSSALAQLVKVASSGKGETEEQREISRRRAKNAMDCVYQEFYRGGPLDLTDVSFETAFNYLSTYSDALPGLSLSRMDELKKIYRVMLNKFPEGFHNPEAISLFVEEAGKNRKPFGHYRSDKKEDEAKLKAELSTIANEEYRYAKFYEDFMNFVRNTPFAPDADLKNSLFQMSTLNESLTKIDPSVAQRHEQDIKQFNNYLSTLSVEDLTQFRGGDKLELSYPDYVHVDRWHNGLPLGQLDADAILLGYRTMLRLNRVDKEFQENLNIIDDMQRQGIRDADQIEKMRHDAYKQCLDVTEQTREEVRDCFHELFSRSIVVGLDSGSLTSRQREALRLILELETRKQPLSDTVFSAASVEHLAREAYDKTTAANPEAAPQPEIARGRNYSSISNTEAEQALNNYGQDADVARTFLHQASAKLVPVQKMIAAFPIIPEGIKNDQTLRLDNLLKVEKAGDKEMLVPNRDTYNHCARFWLNTGHEIGIVLSEGLGAGKNQAEQLLSQYAQRNAEHPESAQISNLANSFRRRFSEVLDPVRH